MAVKEFGFLAVSLDESNFRTDCRVPVAGDALLVSFSLGLSVSAVSAGAILVRSHCQASCITELRYSTLCYSRYSAFYHLITVCTLLLCGGGVPFGRFKKDGKNEFFKS